MTTPIESLHHVVGSRRIGLCGGTTIKHESALFAEELGRQLVAEEGLVLVTGGFKCWKEAPEIASADWAFIRGARDRLGHDRVLMERRIETLLPDPKHEPRKRPVDRFEEGTVLRLTGRSLQSRRFKLVRLVDTLLAIEGAEGTREIIDLALALEKPVLPLPFTGGFARSRWIENRAIIKSWFGVTEATAKSWETLSLQDVSPSELVALATSVMRHLLRPLQRRNAKGARTPMYPPTGRFVVFVHGHPGGPSWAAIQEAVVAANGLQTHFAFKVRPHRLQFHNDATTVEFEKLATAVSRMRPKLHGLFFCEGPFDNELLVNERLPGQIYVSCQVDKGLKAPPFRLYLLHQMAAGALTLAARVTQATNKEMEHRPPIGCIWDWWKDAAQRSAAMVAARICPDCQNALRTHGSASAEAILGCQQILDYIRRSMMGESPQVANRVFIAYGRGLDWMTLRDLLESWGLQVEYFNREPAAGIVVTERWRQMLNQSRFAFAVMTPDDEMMDGTKHARQNVIHEIGLCHARLGLRSTAILLASGTEKFSNVEGVTYIPFDVGKLEAKEQEIRRLLVERGILLT